jgi:thioredoxin-like negative regulator of GroEL
MRTRTSLLLSAALAFAPLAVRADEIPWTTDIKRALADGASSARPVFVDVWAVWCVPCKKMDETTYRDPAVVQAMAGFVPLKVDQDVQSIFCESHDVEALPAILFLDAKGREIARMQGLITAKPLLERMHAVTEGYAGYLTAVERPREDAAAQRTAGAYLLAAGNPEGAADLLRGALKGLKDGAAGERESTELLLAEAQLQAGDGRAPLATLEKLADSAGEPGVRGRALQVLYRAHRDKGRTEQAEAVLQRLRSDYPELDPEKGAP